MFISLVSLFKIEIGLGLMMFLLCFVKGLTCRLHYVGEDSVVVGGISMSQGGSIFSWGDSVAITTATGGPDLCARGVRVLRGPPFLRKEFLIPVDMRLEKRLTAPLMPLKASLFFFSNPTSSSSSAGGTSMFPEYQNTHQMRLRKMTMAPA